MNMLISHADCSRLSVGFFALYLKTYAARITELHIDMFHHECSKPIYLGSNGQRSRSRGTNTGSARVFAVTGVLASSSLLHSHCGSNCERRLAVS